MSEGLLSTTTCLSVSAGSPATNTEAGFAALTYTPSGEVITLSDVGFENEVISFTTLCDGIVAKRAGAVDFTSIDVEAAFVIGNAAQIIVHDAAVARTTVSLMITLSDTTIYYVDCDISNFKTRIGSASDVLMLGFTAIPRNNIVEV